MLPGLIVALEIVLLIGVLKLFYDVAAIRKMLENMGLFSGTPCPSCHMPIPHRAAVCGHCGRDVDTASRPL
jgi:hypothetical protein